MTIRRAIVDNVKNIQGWRTREKLVVFAIDDYGNVRLDSRAAREKLRAAGLELNNRFDQYDALETTQDLEALFEVLSSVSDSLGHSAVFTPYALCANPDFDALRNGEQYYRYEALPQTFERLTTDQPESYKGAWDLWRDGMRQGFLRPQFHGREHLNVQLLERKLKKGDKTLKINLESNSLAALDGDSSMPGVGFTQAFGLWERSEVGTHKEIIEDGLKLFEDIFGFKASTFTPPAEAIHPDLYPWLESLGIRGIYKPRWCVRRIDRGHTVRELNLRLRPRGQRHVSLVRNVVFEPTGNCSVNSVQLALNQIAAAFRWRRPATVSSHRVNFCGHLDPENRTHGLTELKRLLRGIVQRWPDVQFISADELVSKTIADLDKR